jgi:hypothetical protein
MSDKSGTIVRQDDALVLHAFGEEVIVHLDGERTGGKLTMWTELTPPGGGPPPHYHVNEDETFHVIEGRVAFLMDGKWHEVGPAPPLSCREGSSTRSRMLVINRRGYCL